MSSKHSSQIKGKTTPALLSSAAGTPGARSVLHQNLETLNQAFLWQCWRQPLRWELV